MDSNTRSCCRAERERETGRREGEFSAHRQTGGAGEGTGDQGDRWTWKEKDSDIEKNKWYTLSSAYSGGDVYIHVSLAARVPERPLSKFMTSHITHLRACRLHTDSSSCSAEFTILIHRAQV